MSIFFGWVGVVWINTKFHLSKLKPLEMQIHQSKKKKKEKERKKEESLLVALDQLFLLELSRHVSFFHV